MKFQITFEIILQILSPPITDPPAAILVVGGGQSSVELVDLNNGGAQSCISPVATYFNPKNAAGIWLEDKPTICGGGEYYGSVTDKCFSYDMTEGSWKNSSNLLKTR